MAKIAPVKIDFNNKHIKKFKLVVLGNPNVGKTTLTYKLCEDKFLDNVEATIGVDLRSYVVNIEGEDIKLEIWDTAGQERFRRSLISAYYRNADAIVFVYDVTDKQSFNDLRIWIEESARNGLTDVPMVLIANKCDLPATVNRNLAQCFADANGMLVSYEKNDVIVYVGNTEVFDFELFETSSCSNSDCDHVRAIFYTIAQKLKAKKSLVAPRDSVITYSSLAKGETKIEPSYFCNCW